MKFIQTKLSGATIIELEPIYDERGFFMRSWCREEFARHGLNADLAQCNVSFNRKRGTLRGLHYQSEPRAEAKVIRCTRGALFDVIVDLRPDSPSYMQWESIELSVDTYKMLYVPRGFAHGFQTLSDDTEVFYQMSEKYYPDLARGVRWNDPAFGIAWPLTEKIISAKDNAYPDYQAVQ